VFIAILLLGVSSLYVAAQSSEAAIEIPRNIKNNQFFLESLRLANLARLSYSDGDYDSSSTYAEESVRYARLSDEYVARQLKIKQVNDAIAAAKERLDWALSVSANTRYPREYGEARGYYNASLTFRTQEAWDEAIAEANKVIFALAGVRVEVEVEVEEKKPVLPAQYTVRTWSALRDCFWNIAGQSWAYGDPFQWRRLYNANREKLPDPSNPNLIEPGIVLDIPSIRGEVRQGLWDAAISYPPLP
jgi:hypothetical protein